MDYMLAYMPQQAAGCYPFLMLILHQQSRQWSIRWHAGTDGLALGGWTKGLRV